MISDLKQECKLQLKKIYYLQNLFDYYHGYIIVTLRLKDKKNLHVFLNHKKNLLFVSSNRSIKITRPLLP